MVLFMHFWYWFPTANCLQLALAPTCLIGVNKDLKVPKGFQYKSNAKPSLYAYPEHIKEEKEKEKTKTTSVQLSVTQKAKARALVKKQSEMEPEELKKRESSRREEKKEEEKKKKDDKMDVEKDGAKEEEEKKLEPDHEILENPSRILPKQRSVIKFLEDNRYKPILKVTRPPRL